MNQKLRLLRGLAPLALLLLLGGSAACNKTYDFDATVVGDPSSTHLRRPKTSSQFIRGVYADLLGRGPQIRNIEVDDESGKKVQDVSVDEEQLLLQAFDSIADQDPLRAVVVAGLCDSASANLPEKASVADPAAFVAEQFHKLLGREPTTYELVAFEKAWADDPAVGPKTVVRGLVGSREYQSQ